MARVALVAYRAIVQQGRGLTLSYDHVSLSTAFELAGPLDWRAETVYWPRLARAVPTFLGGSCGRSTGARDAAGRPLTPSVERLGTEPALRATFTEHCAPLSGPAAGAGAAHNATRSLWRQRASACIINGLLRPRDDLIPGFSELRAALTATGTFAIGLYLRSGEAETNHLHERPSSCPAHELVARRQRHAAALVCALQLEQRWAAGFSRVVWFVASDSVELRESIVAEFDEPETADGRTVLHTGALGRHTRPSSFAQYAGGRDAFESGFREAVADWWLLGEVDVAVLARQADDVNGGSFAAAAFARSARVHSVFAPAAFVGLRAEPNGEPAAMLTNCGVDESHLMLYPSDEPEAVLQRRRIELAAASGVFT